MRRWTTRLTNIFTATLCALLPLSSVLVSLTSVLLSSSSVHAASTKKKATTRQPATTKPAPKPTTPAKPVPPKEIEEPIKRIFIEPVEVHLTGPRASQLITITAEYNDGSLREITSKCTLATDNPGTATVTEAVVQPVSDGVTAVTAKFQKQATRAAVAVVDAKAAPKYSFISDVAPVLSKAGCNSSNCHGSPVGKGGFKLSLFGYEPEDDYKVIVKDLNGKRVNLTDPANSLFLLKPTMGTAHKGGLRFAKDGPEYKAILGWLQAGAPNKTEGDPTLVGIEILPKERTLATAKQTQQLLVLAKYSDGTTADVTRKATYSSNDEAVGAVEPSGRVTAGNNGEATVMIRYTGKVDIARVGVATGRAITAAEFPSSDNPIDQAVFAKLTKLKLAPSKVCDDVTFLRRAYIDTVAMLPPTAEVRSFVTDTDPAKREKLVDKLLAMPEAADHWALRWSDLLRINQRSMLISTKVAYDWIRDSFVKNKPMSEFAREILTATGSPSKAPPTAFWSQRLFPMAEDRSAAMSQLFLGVRIECARCHNHPFEKWTQNDFYAFTGFFARVQGQGPAQQNEVVVRVLFQGEARHPKTNQPVAPAFLDGTKPAQLPTDRREAVADWIVQPDNPYFGRAMVNRIWKHYFGRGIVEPVDDFRITNPAVNDELLDALAKDFVANNFDLKHTSKLILTSKTYQFATQTNETNEKDEKYFSHYTPKRMVAECLLDAMSQATETVESFSMPPLLGGGTSTRAMQLALPQGLRNGRSSNYFLDVFGTAKRVTICERTDEGSVPQALQLINGTLINSKVSARNGRLAKLIAQESSNEQIIEELFLSAVARFPTADEVKKYGELIRKSSSRQEGLEDLFWALLGSKEFLYNH